MFNKLLGNVEGADFWLIISLVIFGVFFIGVMVNLLFLSKDKVQYLRNIPINETENKNIEL